MPEFDAGVAGGELPVDLALVGVGGVGPGFEFCVEDVDVGDASAQALPGQAGQFESAMPRQLPCLGVWWISRRPARAKAFSGGNAW